MKLPITDQLLATALKAATELTQGFLIKPSCDAFGDRASIYRYVPRFLGELTVVDAIKGMGLKFDYDRGVLALFAKGKPRTIEVFTANMQHHVAVMCPLTADAGIAVRVDEEADEIEILGVCPKNDFKMGMAIDQFPMRLSALSAFDKE